MTLIGTWLSTVQATRTTLGGVPYTPSSTYQSMWSLLRRTAGGDRSYIGAAPAIMHMATPSVWPVCYYPEWVCMSFRGLLNNAPDKLSWVLTKWSLEFLIIRPISELPLTLPCSIVYTDMYSNQSTSCKPIEIWPHWPDVRSAVPIAAFRPVYIPNLDPPTHDEIRSFDEAMAGIVTAREQVSGPVETQMLPDNPFFLEDEDYDDEGEDYEDEDHEEGEDYEGDEPEVW